MGRPPIGPQRPIRLSPEEWAYVEKLGEARNIDRSTSVRRIVQDHMAASAIMSERTRP